jgi:hypothetical protein
MTRAIPTTKILSGIPPSPGAFHNPWRMHMPKHAKRPGPPVIDAVTDLPSGHIAFRASGHVASPSVRDGEVAIVEPADPHIPLEHNAIYLVRWGNSRFDLTCARKSTTLVHVENYEGHGPGFVSRKPKRGDDVAWWAEPAFVPSREQLDTWLRSGFAATSDGPYLEKDLRAKVVGKVVGVIRQQVAGPPKRIAPPNDNKPVVH